MLVRDVRYGLRAFGRSPGFAAAAVLTLALGLGANTPILAVLYNVVLRPLPYPNAGRLAKVYLTVNADRRGVRDIGFSYPKYQELQRTNTVFEALAAYAQRRYTIMDPGPADPDVIGKTLRVDGNRVQIVVARPRPHRPVLAALRHTALTLDVTPFGIRRQVVTPARSRQPTAGAHGIPPRPMSAQAGLSRRLRLLTRAARIGISSTAPLPRGPHPQRERPSIAGSCGPPVLRNRPPVSCRRRCGRGCRSGRRL